MGRRTEQRSVGEQPGASGAHIVSFLPTWFRLGVTEAEVEVGALVPEAAQEEGSGHLFHTSRLISTCVKWPSPGSSQRLMKLPSVRPC